MFDENNDYLYRLHSILMEGRSTRPGSLFTELPVAGVPHMTFMDEGDLSWMFDTGYLDTGGDFDYIPKYNGDNRIMQAKITWLWMKEV